MTDKNIPMIILNRWIFKIYLLSTNRKNPLLFFWSIDNALTAISCSGGSPFCPLSRSTSNSMCEYANKPNTHINTISFIWLCSAVLYQRHYVFQQPIFWAHGQSRIVTRHRFCHNSCLFLNRFQKVPFQSTNEKKTTPLRFSHGVKFHIVRGNNTICIFI